MKPKSGISDLKTLLKNMEPVLNEGEYVFVTVPDTDGISRELPICEIKEKEGTTVVLAKEDAENLNLSFEFVASWITLNVHSALEAVGLTAAFASELGKNDISCNVIAGFYHDHIFVDVNDGMKAMKVLKSMSL